MTPILLRIEDAGPDRKARRLVFDDCSEPRVTSAAAVKALGLAVGAHTDRAAVDSALSEIEQPLAKERALQLLGYRDRSAAELERRLSDSGYPRHIAQPLVSRFAELGLIDDERFARAWIRTRVACGLGARRISRELAEKGIDRDIIELALSQECPSHERLQSAVRALRGASAPDRKQRDRLVRRLVAKGHDLTVAIEAVNLMSSEDDPDPE